MSTTNVAELKQRHEQGEPLQLIDVRSPSEFEAGHLPGAINIPMDQIRARLTDVDIRRPIVLVCQSGRRAAITAEMLKPLGHDVLVLEGGTVAWRQAGHPVVGTGSTDGWALERQVRFTVGVVILVSTMLGAYVDPNWLGLTALAGAGLAMAALLNTCPLGSVLAKMPWNQAKNQPGDSATCVKEV